MSNSIEQLISGAMARRPMAGTLSVQDRTNPIVNVDKKMPWAHSPIPRMVGTQLKGAKFRPTADQTNIELVGDADMPLVLSSQAFSDLTGHLGANTSTLNKLSNGLKCEVLNELSETAPSDSSIQFIHVNGGLRSMTSGWRDICAHSEIAQTAYDALLSLSPDIEVAHYHEGDGSMNMRLITKLERPITPRLGDVLAAGVSVFHQYGVCIRGSLFVKRLACLNGMTKDDTAFSWASKTDAGIAGQLDYVVLSVNRSIAEFDNLATRATQMARVLVEGDPQEAMLARARAMRIPGKYHKDLIDAYNVEGGNSEWDILQAFTRFATHYPELEDAYRDRLWATSGNWVGEFDMVNARMPRPVAERVGAHIFENQTGS